MVSCPIYIKLLFRPLFNYNSKHIFFCPKGTVWQPVLRKSPVYHPG